MPFTFEEKCFNKVFRQEKGWGAKRICSEFRQKKWAVSAVNDLLLKIDKTGSVERKVGSGRPRSIQTQRNISRVNDLIWYSVTRYIYPLMFCQTFLAALQLCTGCSQPV